MAKRKGTIQGDLNIPKPTKKAMEPNLDFSNDIQTDFYTLDPIERVQLSRIKDLKGDNLEVEKIKK